MTVPETHLEPSERSDMSLELIHMTMALAFLLIGSLATETLVRTRRGDRERHEHFQV
jgi:hypothetical protein